MNLSKVETAPADLLDAIVSAAGVLVFGTD
jgi:hypothetical protein